MSLKGARWREAATLILAAQTNPVTSLLPGIQKANYQILMMRRSSRSKFLPNSCVFPGGAVEDLDFDWRWKDLYQKITQLSFDKLHQTLRVKGQRPPAYTVERDTNFPPEIGFRIAAIRETFEESGILLLKPHGDFTTLSRTVLSDVHNFLSAEDALSWREKVRKNCGEFFTLCERLGAVPDVWSLHEWSNWLTPWEESSGKSEDGKIRRFDTLFFLSCLNTTPVATTDEMEVTAPQWDSPGNLIMKYRQEKIRLIPPQLVELGRMCSEPLLDGLCQFSHWREALGTERCMPSILFVSDGVVMLYPGDELYPDPPDWEGKLGFRNEEKTIRQMQEGGKNVNRVLYANKGFKNGKMLCNMSRLGHAIPMEELQNPSHY